MLRDGVSPSFDMFSMLWLGPHQTPSNSDDSEVAGISESSHDAGIVGTPSSSQFSAIVVSDNKVGGD